MKPLPETTLVMAVCDEEHHLTTLLPYLRPYFSEIVIGVQVSTDRTGELVEKYADKVIRDSKHGFGDATFPAIQRQVSQPWSFRIDADEKPQRQLLESLRDAPAYCQEKNLDGLWIPARLWIDRTEWGEPHSALRFWASRIEWPPYLHSRPMTEKTEIWRQGFIEHRKTLDEQVEGFLSYLQVGRGNETWDYHNLSTLKTAVANGVRQYGWSNIESRPWWGAVLELVYQGQHP